MFRQTDSYRNRIEYAWKNTGNVQAKCNENSFMCVNIHECEDGVALMRMLRIQAFPCH
jgi:hypothetical protein